MTSAQIFTTERSHRYLRATPALDLGVLVRTTTHLAARSTCRRINSDIRAPNGLCVEPAERIGPAAAFGFEVTNNRSRSNTFSWHAVYQKNAFDTSA